MSLFMSIEELGELTGRMRHRDQVKWLNQNNWRYALDAQGKPRVAKEYFNQKLCNDISKKTADNGPRWDLLKSR